MTSALLAILLFWQGADCRSCDLLANAASALSAGSSVRFMGYLDKDMPGYHDIEVNVSALIAQNDISASLDVLSESGDDDRVEALVDWFLQTTSKDGTEHVTRRRMRVRVVERKVRGRWRIAGISPGSILDPIPVGSPQ